MKTLTKNRNKIDKINQKILRLLAKRMQASKEIGEYKKATQSKIIDRVREKQMLDRISKKAGNYNLNKTFINNIFQEIMDESKRLQKK